MKKIIISLFFVQLVLISSCTDVIDVNVPNGGGRLVVDASIKWERGTTGQMQTIYLSTSSAYFEENKNIPVTGATVIVTKDDDGSQFLFNDQQNGAYSAQNFVPEMDQSYTLEIQTNGNTYLANEVLKSTIPIGRIEQEADAFDDSEIEVVVYFDDPEGTDDFYLAEFKGSNRSLISLAVGDDRFMNGSEISLEYEDENLVAGIIVDVELQGISEEYFNYMDILIGQSGSDDGGPFPTTPVRLNGNCKNVDNPDEEVLGYFRLSEVVSDTYTIN